MGAEIAMPFGHERMEKRVRPLAESIGAEKFVMPCDVQNDQQMDDLFAKIEKEWGPSGRNVARYCVFGQGRIDRSLCRSSRASRTLWTFLPIRWLI